jgi:hypothetical protein
MKIKTDNLGTIKKLVGWAGVLTYLDINRQLAAGERDSALTSSMVEVARINLMLHELGAGQAGQVKQMLTAQLTYNLTAIDGLASAADPKYTPFAKMVVETVAQNERRNPGYYGLTSVAPVSLEKAQMAQVVAH